MYVDALDDGYHEYHGIICMLKCSPPYKIIKENRMFYSVTYFVTREEIILLFT